MRKLNLLLAAAVAVTGLAWSAQSFADYHGYAYVHRSAATLPPLGFQLFCLQNPQQCRAKGKSSVRPTADVMAMLVRVNASVNRSIRPRNDAGADVWTANPRSGYGDCEDYALTKRARLIGMGLSPSALRLAYVKTSWGEGHAVLVVRTSNQELVLDNLTQQILPLHSTGLHLVSMSSSNPLVWDRG